MANASSPPQKRRHTFVASPGPGKEPTIIALANLEATSKMTHNVAARVNFISIGGLTTSGEEIIGLELTDDNPIKEPIVLTILGKNNVAAMKGIVINDVVKLRNVRCTIYKGGVSLIVSATGTAFRVSKLIDDAPEAEKLEEAAGPEVTSINETADTQEGVATLMARVLELNEDCLGEAKMNTDKQDHWLMTVYPSRNQKMEASSLEECRHACSLIGAKLHR